MERLGKYHRWILLLYNQFHFITMAKQQHFNNKYTWKCKFAFKGAEKEMLGKKWFTLLQKKTKFVSRYPVARKCFQKTRCLAVWNYYRISAEWLVFVFWLWSQLLYNNILKNFWYSLRVYNICLEMSSDSIK